MAKVIKYKLCNKVNFGTEKEPDIKECFYDVVLPCIGANEEIAKREAHNGEYTIEDDGLEEPEAEATLENRVETLETDSTEMKEALGMILNGVTE